MQYAGLHGNGRNQRLDLIAMSWQQRHDQRNRSGTAYFGGIALLPGSARSAKQQAQAKRSCAGRCGSLQNLILKRDAFRVVFLQPRFRGVLIGKDFEVILVANLLAGVDVNPDCHVQSGAASSIICSKTTPAAAHRIRPGNATSK
jgi:hypothetical protein